MAATSAGEVIGPRVGPRGGPSGTNVSRGPVARALWYRELDRYPGNGPRFFYLGLVVVATIILYYQLYVAGAVAPQILAHYGMSFRFYVDITVVGNAIGAFTSVLAGLADKWGRANLVAYGLVITALLILFGIPSAPSSWAFAVIISAVGFVEGIILVATPALVRDFSPQLGRASAMGFWTLGPVVGSLVVSAVASNTLSHLVAWQDQFIICGIVSVAIAAAVLVGLRELSPGLRNQLMVSIRDRALVEARAKGIDLAETSRHPWRQVVKLDVILSAFAISVFLLIYYTAVGFNPIYFETVFGLSPSQANGIGNWFWAFDAITLVVVGIVSDRLRVRKPFMVVGAAGAAVMTIIYLGRSTPHTTATYGDLALLATIMSIFVGCAYSPWMASFTETVERRNPALVAHGLAVWGWIIRAVVAISVFVLPFVVSTVTPLVHNAGVAKHAQAIENADPTIKIVLAHQALFTELAKHPVTDIPAPLLARAVKEVGLKDLLAVHDDPHITEEVAFFAAHASELRQVATAAAATPGQWQNWYWVCVGGELAFLPLIFLMVGRWSPRRAKQDADKHERIVAEQLAKARAPAPA